ncbi:Hypothetical predicted protein, partial [Marmota monax]
MATQESRLGAQESGDGHAGERGWARRRAGMATQESRLGAQESGDGHAGERGWARRRAGMATQESRLGAQESGDGHAGEPAGRAGERGWPRRRAGVVTQESRLGALESRAGNVGEPAGCDAGLVAPESPADTRAAAGGLCAALGGAFPAAAATCTPSSERGGAARQSCRVGELGRRPRLPARRAAAKVSRSRAAPAARGQRRAAEAPGQPAKGRRWEAGATLGFPPAETASGNPARTWAGDSAAGFLCMGDE